MAFQMGESELVSRMTPDLPTGQAANILVESVKEMIASLNQDMRQYQAGIIEHSEKLADQQSDIKNLVTPEVWSQLEGHLGAVLEANAEMKRRVVEAETKMAKKEQQVAQLQRKTRCDPFRRP
jgi:predicted  nucleic acid-binding Zn-ribbon protein